ncbi:MAG: phosphohydrolase [Coriobacteriia bacterium]|nr:phosphohydrolase [Coriobacteriia bacterium]MCL2537587.1 phosphohydrolase [Coriobacteriia bacterium]
MNNHDNNTLVASRSDFWNEVQGLSQDDPVIITGEGIIFHLVETTPEMIVPKDIAHALSNMARANGHFKHFFSVGQHSLQCYEEALARGLSLKVQLGCLLHDASEAYLSDVTRPLKRLLPDYTSLEYDLNLQIYARFGLCDMSNAEREMIDEIDDALLLHEFEALHRLGSWETPPAIASKPDFSYRPMDEVRDEFLATLAQLQAHLS